MDNNQYQYAIPYPNGTPNTPYPPPGQFNTQPPTPSNPSYINTPYQQPYNKPITENDYAMKLVRHFASLTAEEMINLGAADLVGFGRGSIAYPMFYRDWLDGKFDVKKCCVSCSKCTALMRA